MDSHRKFAIQSKLSSQDQNSLAGDMGFPPAGPPIADLLEQFKNHIEKEEEEEANRQRLGYHSEVANPDM